MSSISTPPNSRHLRVSIEVSAVQTARRLDRDLALREAIERDGQTVESFDITKGTSSGRGVNEAPAGTDSADLKDALRRADGASEEDLQWDALHRGER